MDCQVGGAYHSVNGNTGAGLDNRAAKYADRRPK